ncbi:MAG: hypothetical protein ACSLEZ_00180, partial [Thiobacillus sp.]
MSESTPTKNFTLKPDGKVITTWAVIGSVIVGTAVIVGGLFSIKADIASASSAAEKAAEKASTAALDAKQALEVVRDIKDDIQRMRWQIGLDAAAITTKPPSST